MPAYTYKDLAFEASYEFLGLIFDLVSVWSFDDDKYGYYMLFVFFLIYPMVTTLLEQLCTCCGLDCWTMTINISLTLVKVIVYSFFSGFDALPIFIGLGIISVGLSIAQYRSAGSPHEEESEGGEQTNLQVVAERGAGCLNVVGGCCCGNAANIIISSFLISFTFFPEGTVFRENAFEYVTTILLWSTGYTLSHVGDVLALKMADEVSGATLWKSRMMMFIRFAGYCGSLYIVYLCIMHLFSGSVELWHVLVCIASIVGGLASVVQGLCCDLILAPKERNTEEEQLAAIAS